MTTDAELNIYLKLKREFLLEDIFLCAENAGIYVDNKDAEEIANFFERKYNEDDYFFQLQEAIEYILNLPER